MRNKKNKAIKSAESVAALRASAHQDTDREIKCKDYLAKHFLKNRYKLLTSIKPHSLQKKILEKIAPGSYNYIVTRTKHFDEILLNEIANNIEQLVILGAGYDTRGIRFQEALRNASIFEVDIHSTQSQKKNVLNKKISFTPPQNYTFVSLDFTKDDLRESLEKHGFSITQKTLFLWEGVSYYLPEKDVKKTLNFVSLCKKGSSIVFDYSIKSFVLGDHSTYGGKKLAKWLKKIKEPFLFGLAPEETANFIKECNLKLLSDLGPEELSNQYLINSKGKIEGNTLGHARMVHASS